jgi:predicted GH43/DUF377 family glycosyl hydrolase
MVSSLTPLLLTFQSESVQGAAASPAKWIRYASNPILSQGAVGSWESTCIYTHCIINDSGIFKMWYGGSTKAYMDEKIGYATSNDGKSWTKYAGNPVMGNGSFGSWDGASIGSMCVIKDDSTYKMWYYGNNGTVGRIGYATSDDGINWTKYAGNPVMGIGAGGAWDSNEIGPNCVIKDNDEYKMWYGGSEGNHSQVGYANSSDGINWTRYANNPVLKIGASGAWDDDNVGYFCAVNVSGMFHGWFGGDSGTYWGIGYANSSDGICWTKYASNPVMSRTGSGWERHDNFCPWVIFNGTTYQMWYTGVDSSYSPWVYRYGYAEGWNTVPNAPSLTAPSNNVWTANNRPTFSWTFSDPNSQDSQTAYQVQLDNDSAFGSIDNDTGKVTSAAATYTPASGIADGIYYWRARAWDSDDDNGSWSSSRIIKIDTVPPVNPPTISSTSHMIGVWSNDRTIDISFSGASDALSGLDGYSYIWDYSCSTIPDGTKDIEETVSARTSPAMSDSASIFFHIRAIDNAGSIAADASHYGPFFVDYTIPSNPTVASSTHSPGMWTNLPVCNVSWSGANGSISGLDGYSAVWDNSASTVPPALKNFTAEENNTTSPMLSDGSWYFHIRTRDNAGNWANSAAHFGPVRVDTTPPSNPITISSDPPPGVWSNDNTVDVLWGGSNGSISGLDGYSYIWDSSPVTVPDETKECEEGTTCATSPGLSDGTSWYFHIRTRDNASNWNASAVHLGPFMIDASAPSNPIALSSGSHALRRWSNDTTMDVGWSVAEGGGGISGYDGFSIAWDTSSFTVPDSTIDCDANTNSATSPPLSDSNSIYFHIRAKDQAGNWAAETAHLGPFWIDSTPPRNPSLLRSASHSPEKWISDSTVDIDWSGADGSISGIDGYSFLWDTQPFTIPPEYVNASSEVQGCSSPLPTDGAQWYFHIRTRDGAGNWAAGAAHSGPYYIDTIPPVIHGFIINGGASFTTSRTVSLRLPAADPEPGSGLGQMRWRQDGGNWSEWQDYADVLKIDIHGAEGLRTMSVQVRDRAGNFDAAVDATIFLDTQSPAAVGFSINNGANSTNTTSVELGITAVDSEPSSGIAEMSFSENGVAWSAWEPFRATRKYDLAAGDGAKTIYARLRDSAGNIGGTARDSIFLDTVAPVSLAITIAGGNACSTNLSVLVQSYAADPEPASGLSEMTFSEDGTTWSQWEAYSPTRKISLSPGEGMRALYAKVRDKAMNEAGPVGDTILVDTQAPKILSVHVSVISTSVAVVSWSTDEPSDGMVEYGIGAGYGSNLADSAFSTGHNVTLTGLATGTGYHVRVSGRDLYGNGPTVGDERQFKTKSVVVNPAGFGLTTETFPWLLVVVMALAMSLTVGLYAAGKRNARRAEPAPRPPQDEPPASQPPVRWH